MNREQIFQKKLRIQQATRGQLKHEPNCMSVPGPHHPEAGTNMLCTCGAVEALLQQSTNT